MRTFGLFVLAFSLLIVGETFATPINITEKEPVTADSDPTSTYTNNIILPSHDFYQLYWNHTNETITFEVHVRDAAWVLFGLKSESYSDVIVAAVFEDGTGHFSERVIGNTNYTLTPKPTHNWRLLDAFKRNNSTVVKFSRSIKLDCLNDSSTPHVGIDITTGRNRLVLATGSKFDRTDNSITIAHLYSKRVELLSNVTSESQLGCLRSEEESIRFESAPTEEYANQIDLVPGVYRVYWNVTETNITAEVHVRTKSWIGFGFSPSGGMIGSNVVIGYVMSNGSVHFSERHITVPSVSGITLTRNQTAHLLASGRLNEYVYFKFTRLINVCDSEHVSIKKGTPHLIYAFGEDPLGPGDEISYHGFVNRGSVKVNLISVTNSDTPIPEDTHYVDFSIKNVILPKVETYYYSQLFEVPKSLANKRHIYMFEVLTSEVNRKNIHHMIVFECPSTYMGHPGQTSHNSFTDIVTSRICKTASFGWGTGSEPRLFLPSTTGYPIGGDTDYSHFVVEIHYNNPKLAIGYIDSITLRYHLTEHLRPNELGMLTVGTLPSSHAIVLPPNANKFTLETFCHSTCIKYAFDQNPNMTNITIVGSLLHTHMAGIAVETKIVRNGIDMGYIFGNDLYDYNYQQTYMLKPFVNITKDDEMIHRCTYSTTGRQSFTLGGFAAKEEMCYNFMLYYPRGWFRNCSSVPYLNDYVDFLNDLSKSGDLKLDFKLNYNHRNLSYGIDKAVEQLVGHPVASRVKHHLINFFNTTRVSELCGELVDLGPKERLVPVKKQVEPNVCV